MKSIVTIKQWAQDDQPREKLLKHGPKALSNAELIALLLSSGNKTNSVLELARLLLDGSDNDLQHFSRLSLEELLQFHGIGLAKASKLIAVAELGRRRQSPINQSEVIRISSSHAAYEYLKSVFLDLYTEEFHVLLLNRANIVLRSVLISKGGMHGTVVDGKIVFKRAILENACSVILAHNHPSGLLIPSEEDITMTNRLVEFGKMIDLPVKDHLIFTQNGYFSFLDKNLISV